ncbi:hypothetical protein ACA910_018069 [Epithemia clementina (nom. ined.)]
MLTNSQAHVSLVIRCDTGHSQRGEVNQGIGFRTWQSREQPIDKPMMVSLCHHAWRNTYSNRGVLCAQGTQARAIPNTTTTQRKTNRLVEMLGINRFFPLLHKCPKKSSMHHATDFHERPLNKFNAPCH